MSGRRLSFLEASATIMGAGVGSGILAAPYLAAGTGFLTFSALLALCLAANVLAHLMLVEVSLRDGGRSQIVELMARYAFRGRAGKAALILVFSLLLVAFAANLSAYLAGAGDVVSGIAGIPAVPAKLAVYALCALVALFGLKAVGFMEKLALLGMLAFVAVLAAALPSAHFDLPAANGAAEGFLRSGPAGALGLFSVLMYCLFAFFAVPQVVEGLGIEGSSGGKRAAGATVLGLCMNAALTFFVALVAIGVSRPVTEVAVVGIGRALGGFATLACSAFVVLAMATSYWSVALALADVIRERAGWGDSRRARTASWFAATAPSFLLIAARGLGFADYLRIAGGITTLVVMLVTAPLYLGARSRAPVADPEFSFGERGGKAAAAALVVLAVLMAAGSIAAL
jgi:amino acid permease